MKSEDTILNQTGNENEETQLLNEQTQKVEPTTQQTAGKKSSWKQVTIGGASGILLGGASVFFSGASNANDDPDAPSHGSQSTTNGEGTPVSPDSSVTVDGLPVATVSDDMSFNEAFAAAREEVGAGGVFEWHGGVYGTYYANEWNSMTPEQQSEFGNRVSYGASETSAHHETNGHTTTETHTTEIPVETGNRPEVTHVEEPTNNPDNEVQIVGVHEATMEDGSVATFGEMNVHGQEVFVVDVDHDGTFDIMMSDMNNDGTISENEMANIQDQGMTVADFQQSMQSSTDNYLANNDMPDYTNDADVSELV